jgi:PleD family two-component response regulator
MEAGTTPLELKRLEELSQRVGFLTQMASMARYNELAQLSSALELLLYHLQEKKAAISDSCRYTIAAAVAFLTLHLERFEAAPLEPAAAPPKEILLVDDDPVSTRGVAQALVLAKMRVTTLADPLEALDKLRHTAFGLVLLDVELPRMNGMALCEQIRRLDRHRRTPVVFITGHHDSKTRARSILSGGTDFISKPILPIELTVKVITLLLQARMDALGK